MVGKASLIMILGFSLIFMVMGYFWGDLATRSVDNHTSYYKGTIAHNIAVTGANIALREIWEDSNWVAGISGRPFERGVMNVTVDLVPNYRHVISVGTFMGVDRTVEVKIGRSTFAKYAWLIQAVSTGSNNRPWITGDTIYGGFHSNQFLMIDGDPVFYGKVSVEKGINKTPGSDPQFLGGYQTGVTVDEASKVTYTAQKELAKTTQDLNPTANCYFDKSDIWFDFFPDGTVSFRTPLVNNHGGDTTKFTAPSTPQPLTQMAPGGLIYVWGNVYMSGTLDGQVTLVCDGSSGSGGAGNVYLVDDMVYKDNPMVPIISGGAITGYEPNNDCDDLLGVLSTNNIVIATSKMSGAEYNNVTMKDIHLDGGYFSNGGGVHMENLNTSPLNTTPAGTIYLRGSMTAGKEEIVAIYDKNALIAGYNRHVVLDERFLVKPPLYFPYSTDFEVLSWLE